MDFRLTPEQEALKKEFEEFFEECFKSAPPGWTGLGGMDDMLSSKEGWTFHREIARKLGAKGWLSLTWPKEYGGLGYSLLEQFIFNEVSGYSRSPGVDVLAVDILASVLLAMGNEEQKKKHLPGIASGSVIWAQGWSEPDAGSDLASLKTRAVRKGDEYIIDGQKIWSSQAHLSDWCHMLVRTDPTQKHTRGLSYILVDLKTPGITINPIPNMCGHGEFNEIFFDNVPVPAENMVGEENKGWLVTRFAMDFERISFVREFGRQKRNIEDLVALCNKAKRNGEPLAKDPLVRNRLAELAGKAEVGLALTRQVAWAQYKGKFTAADASAIKIWSGELALEVVQLASRILGSYTQIKEGSKWAPFNGDFERLCQTWHAWNIAGGTPEIQRNIVAWEGLGLPRVG